MLTAHRIEVKCPDNVLCRIFFDAAGWRRTDQQTPFVHVAQRSVVKRL